MKQILGLFLIAVGVGAGLAFGFGWGLIGGLMLVIEQIKAPAIDAFTLAYGVARILATGLISVTSIFVCVLPGIALFAHSSK